MKTKFSVITFGCSFNKHDSEIMIGYLKDKYEYVEDYKKADLVIINTCSVKNSAETKAFKIIRELEKLNKKIIVGGCIPQAEISYLNNKLKNYSVIGVNEIDKVNFVVEETLKDKVIHNIFNKVKKNPFLRLNENNYRFNEVIEIIPINEGCLNKCSYCKTKLARGNLYSYPIHIIVEKIRDSLKEGVKEFWLTSQDTACYGFDIHTNLNELIKEILKISGDFKIRIGMGNPAHFKKIIDELLDIIEKDNRIYKFLHIPLQSGSNRILKDMRRGNTKEDYLELIDKIKSKDKNFTISNDIIVAYPTETWEEFLETVKVLEKTKPEVLNLSRFWLRRGTEVEKKYSGKDFIDGKESKKRSAIVNRVFRNYNYEKNKKWVGKEEIVLINEYGKNGTLKGRNQYYKPIIITNLKNNRTIKLGDYVKVKIIDFNEYELIGEIIK